MCSQDQIKNVSSISFLLLSCIAIGFLVGILVWYICSLPSEERGSNIEPLEVSFNFFIVDYAISAEELSQYIREANNIWNKYNISIKINKTIFVNGKITDSEKKFLFDNITMIQTNDEIEKICTEQYIPLLNKITNNQINMGIIFMNIKTIYGGRSSLCGYKFAILTKENGLTGWNLAHEIGHIFGLEDIRNETKQNLMNDKCKIFLASDFLNQKQINVVM
ncbi:MAG: zinc-dependent metalloprotease family protein [Candidatus Micrarchaeia archaeon]